MKAKAKVKDNSKLKKLNKITIKIDGGRAKKKK